MEAVCGQCPALRLQLPALLPINRQVPVQSAAVYRPAPRVEVAPLEQGMCAVVKCVMASRDVVRVLVRQVHVPIPDFGQVAPALFNGSGWQRAEAFHSAAAEPPAENRDRSRGVTPDTVCCRHRAEGEKVPSLDKGRFSIFC